MNSTFSSILTLQNFDIVLKCFSCPFPEKYTLYYSHSKLKERIRTLRAPVTAGSILRSARRGGQFGWTDKRSRHDPRGVTWSNTCLDTHPHSYFCEKRRYIFNGNLGPRIYKLGVFFLNLKITRSLLATCWSKEHLCLGCAFCLE